MRPLAAVWEGVEAECLAEINAGVVCLVELSCPAPGGHDKIHGETPRQQHNLRTSHYRL